MRDVQRKAVSLPLSASKALLALLAVLQPVFHVVKAG
jgi:hypothetical protein